MNLVREDGVHSTLAEIKADVEVAKRQYNGHEFCFTHVTVQSLIEAIEALKSMEPMKTKIKSVNEVYSELFERHKHSFENKLSLRLLSAVSKEILKNESGEPFPPNGYIMEFRKLLSEAGYPLHQTRNLAVDHVKHLSLISISTFDPK